MEELDFQPAKSKHDFRANYKLHDLAELIGKNLFIQCNVKFNNFGEDRRFEKLWEKGEDKPDMIISYKGKSALLDWKGKRKNRWIVNERAVKSYEHWHDELKLPLLICFFVFDNENKVIDRRFSLLDIHQYKKGKKRQWDKNRTVEFIGDLPVFNKSNLIKYVFDKTCPAKNT